MWLTSACRRIDPLDVTELHDKLAQFDKQGVHKLVLDLRDCTRGDVPGSGCWPLSFS